MMESPEEKTKFVAIQMNQHRLTIVTPHWKVVPCWKEDCDWTFEHNHRIFDPKQQAREPQMIVIDVCRDMACPILGTHGHQGKKEEETTTMEVPAEVVEQLKEPEANTLSMMNEGDPNDIDVPVAAGEDKNDKMTITQYGNPEGFTVVTTQWKKVICEEEGCPQESQHAHIVFAPEDEPTTRIKKIKLHYCKDQECEEKENIHAH